MSWGRSCLGKGSKSYINHSYIMSSSGFAIRWTCVYGFVIRKLKSETMRITNPRVHNGWIFLVHSNRGK